MQKRKTIRKYKETPLDKKLIKYIRAIQYQIFDSLGISREILLYGKLIRGQDEKKESDSKKEI
jgi:hypothetical protein